MQAGTLILHTWDRPSVQIASAQPLNTRSFGPGAVAGALHGGDIPIFATSVQTPQGPLTLPAEDFALNALPAGPHAGVQILGSGRVDLLIPNDTALMLATVNRGFIAIQNYRNGTFVARVHNGGIRLQNVGGAGYAEVARGPIVAANSSFDRLRARTAVGNIIFENCASKQIQVDSVNGSILYDNGSFQPGLARFQSQYGNVGIGVARGDVQVGAHSSAGQIFSSLDGRALTRAGMTDARAQFGNGATVVTASSERGAVYVYNGRLKAKARGANWQRLGRIAMPRLPAAGRRGPRHPR